MTTFTAQHCFADLDGNSFKAGLADRQYETARYVLFERLKQPTAQDLKFGFELPYLEIDDQGFGGYGLVDRIYLFKSELQIALSEEGKDVLCSDRDLFTVKLEAGMDVDLFSEALKVIFEDRFQKK